MMVTSYGRGRWDQRYITSAMISMTKVAPMKVKRCRHRGIELVDEAAGGFERHRDHRQDHQHRRGDEPGGAGRADAARERRGRAGGTPAAAAATGGRRTTERFDRGCAADVVDGHGSCSP